MGMWIILIPILAFILLFWLSGFFFGAAFQSSSDKELRRIVEFANAKKRDKVVDIGSGTGKVVIEFAKKGIETHGFEINPLLVWISRNKINKFGLEKKAFIHQKNFWKENLNKFDIIIVFQIGYLMGRLEKKLEKELKKETRVISNNWKFPNKKPKKKVRKVYLYKF